MNEMNVRMYVGKDKGIVNEWMNVMNVKWM